MVALRMHTTIPRGVEVYVFGSSLVKHSRPRDLDLLFVYDPDQVPHGRAYEHVRIICAQLELLQKLRTHPTVLSQSEEASERFITSKSCVPLTRWLDAHNFGSAVSGGDR